MNQKIVALPAGFFFVQTVNIVRIISSIYQFNVLLMPILAPVCLWFMQLKESPLREALANNIRQHQTRLG